LKGPPDWIDGDAVLKLAETLKKTEIAKYG